MVTSVFSFVAGTKVPIFSTCAGSSCFGAGRCAGSFACSSFIQASRAGFVGKERIIWRRPDCMPTDKAISGSPASDSSSAASLRSEMANSLPIFPVLFWRIKRRLVRYMVKKVCLTRTPAVLMVMVSPGIRSGSPIGFSSEMVSMMVISSEGFSFSASVSITMSLLMSGLACSAAPSAGTASGFSPMIFLILSTQASRSPSLKAGEQGKVQIISFCPDGVEKVIFTAGSRS